MGLYRDNGRENGNYYLGVRVWDLGLELVGFGFRIRGVGCKTYRAFTAEGVKVLGSRVLSLSFRV